MAFKAIPLVTHLFQLGLLQKFPSPPNSIISSGQGFNMWALRNIPDPKYNVLFAFFKSQSVATSPGSLSCHGNKSAQSSYLSTTSTLHT